MEDLRPRQLAPPIVLLLLLAPSAMLPGGEPLRGVPVLEFDPELEAEPAWAPPMRGRRLSERVEGVPGAERPRNLRINPSGREMPEDEGREAAKELPPLAPPPPAPVDDDDSGRDEEDETNESGTELTADERLLRELRASMARKKLLRDWARDRRGAWDAASGPYSERQVALCAAQLATAFFKAFMMAPPWNVRNSKIPSPVSHRLYQTWTDRQTDSDHSSYFKPGKKTLEMQYVAKI